MRQWSSHGSWQVQNTDKKAIPQPVAGKPWNSLPWGVKAARRLYVLKSGVDKLMEGNDFATCETYYYLCLRKSINQLLELGE